MDKILAYVLENLKQLTPFHLLLILLLTIVASAGMFFVFRWLFASRLDAQKDLLEMKSEQVTELKARFSELKSEGVQLSQELAQAKGSLSSASPPAAPMLNLATLRVRLAIIALMWMHTLQHFRVSLWSVLAIYAELEVQIRAELPSAPTAEQLRESLEAATESFKAVDLSPDAFQRFEPAIEGDASAPYPAGLIEFPFNETSEALYIVQKEMNDWLDALFPKIEGN